MNNIGTGEGAERYVNDSRECPMRNRAYCTFMFSHYSKKRGGEKGEEERKIEKSSGGKRSGCLIEIENGALSISLSFSLSLRASVIVPRSRVRSLLCSASQIGILITFFSARDL